MRKWIENLAVAAFLVVALSFGGPPAGAQVVPDVTAPVSVATGTTTQIVAGTSTGAAIHVTAYLLYAGGTGNATWEYGAKTTNPCDTGTTALSGILNMTAQTHVEMGNGAGTIFFVPPGNALCLLTSASVQISGHVSYQEF